MPNEDGQDATQDTERSDVVQKEDTCTNEDIVLEGNTDHDLG